MRAARVLDLLLTLQRRGRCTARELAAQLEVSERTVLRDIEALSEAGVPVYASRGAGGGIALLDGFHTQLTGLTPKEAAVLPLALDPGLAALLGLGGAAGSARAKVLAALGHDLAGAAAQVPGWFLHDPEPADPVLARELPRLARAVRERRRVELSFDGAGPEDAGPEGRVTGLVEAGRVEVGRVEAAPVEPEPVDPLGLVLAAGGWYLVLADPGAPAGIRAPALRGLRAARLTAQRFDHPAGFDLARAWARSKPTP